MKLKQLKLMTNGKSPGSDGFQAEFYKKISHDVGKYLLNSLNIVLHTRYSLKSPSLLGATECIFSALT